MENKFTGKAQHALSLAISHAQNFGHSYIGSEHLLLGLLEERDSVASRMLNKRGISYNKIKNDIAVGWRSASSRTSCEGSPIK